MFINASKTVRNPDLPLHSCYWFVVTVILIVITVLILTGIISADIPAENFGISHTQV
jgi:hypothetical protein